MAVKPHEPVWRRDDAGRAWLNRSEPRPGGYGEGEGDDRPSNAAHHFSVPKTSQEVTLDRFWVERPER